MATNSTLSPDYLAESKTHMVTTMYAIPIALEALSTGWRLWASASTQSGFSFDDYLMLFATVWLQDVVWGVKRANKGFEAGGHDCGDYIFSHFYDIAIAFTKLSILALYYRIFVTRKFRLIVLGTACFVCVWVIVMEVTLGLGCRPIKAWWGEAKGRCINKEAFTYFTNVTNMVTDLWVFLMPIPVILGLQAAKEKRITLCLMFGVGLAVLDPYSSPLPTRPCKRFLTSGVATGDEASLGILSAWEPCGAILCANLPPIYRHLVIISEFLRAGVRNVTQWTVTQSRSAATGVSSDRHGGDKGKVQHHDWAELNHSDAFTGETNRTVTEVSAQGPPSDAVEMDGLKAGGIMVERAFTQVSAQDVEAASSSRDIEKGEE
ncbi:uncharacterized protein Triagg1_7456 [Trichoderma aggressivum f. europaeum]|uniref:Rhodopsin domain-containing protein n=1 Tax=Trichoderma aggressivum f. europaeum TaxID=173218 RepID=A0AAE1LXS4_9HYPO|nr:hypothetical protein Triagg1_7456 [Trichoderma aggressivum f. europaeum]